MILLIFMFLFVLFSVIIGSMIYNLRCELISLNVLISVSYKNNKESAIKSCSKFDDKLEVLNKKMSRVCEEIDKINDIPKPPEVVKKDARNEGLRKYWEKKREEKQRLLLSKIRPQQEQVAQAQAASYPQT